MSIAKGKLVFHSDQITGNTEVDKVWLKEKDVTNLRIGYIPSQSDRTRKYFQQKVEWYKQFGITDMVYFDLDQEYDEQKITELLGCQAIHLSGGDTYQFLHSIKKRNFASTLQNYFKQGGTLVGVSAGSIVMTSSIDITNLYQDDNTTGLTDFSSLGLVDFEFFAHLNDREQWVKTLQDYSTRNNGRVIYACNDGDGIIVSDNEIQLFGNILKIQNGDIVKTR
jgi:dipeptidase E